MPKIRIIETAKLPTGKVRFVETQPALREKFEEARNQGKVTTLPQEYSNEGDLRVVKTTTLWNNKSDYEIFQTWYDGKYLALGREYNLSNSIIIDRVITEE